MKARWRRETEKFHCFFSARAWWEGGNRQFIMSKYQATFLTQNKDLIYKEEVT